MAPGVDACSNVPCTRAVPDCAVSVLYGDTGSRRKAADAAEVVDLLPPGSMWAWAVKGIAAFHGKLGASASKKVKAMWGKIEALKGADCQPGTVAAARWMGERIVKEMAECGGLPHEDIPEDVVQQCQVVRPQPGDVERLEAALAEEIRMEKAEKAARKAAAATAAAEKARKKTAGARKAAADDQAAKKAAADKAAGASSRLTGNGLASAGQGEQKKRRRDESECAGPDSGSKRVSRGETGDGAGLADRARRQDKDSEPAGGQTKSPDAPQDMTPPFASPASPAIGENPRGPICGSASSAGYKIHSTERFTCSPTLPVCGFC